MRKLCRCIILASFFGCRQPALVQADVEDSLLPVQPAMPHQSYKTLLFFEEMQYLESLCVPIHSRRQAIEILKRCLVRCSQHANADARRSAHLVVVSSPAFFQMRTEESDILSEASSALVIVQDVVYVVKMRSK